MTLPIYRTTRIIDDDQDPCEDCPLCNIDEKCTRLPVRRFDLEGHICEPDDPVDLLIVGDAPTRSDNRMGVYLGDDDGKSILEAVKDIGVNSFVIVPAVRCYPGQVDHFVLPKKFRFERNQNGDKPLDRAMEAIKSCKHYVTRARASYQPKVTLSLGALASEALGKGGNIVRLRSKPLYPNPGLAAASRTEGTLFTWDRAYARVSPWAAVELMRDVEEKLPNLMKTGYATPRGDDTTVEQTWLTTVPLVRKFVNACLTDPEIPSNDLLSFDFEALNLERDKTKNRILNVGLSFTSQEDVSYVIPLQHPETPFSAEEIEEVFKILGELWEAENAPFYGFLAHNAQFETEMIDAFWGIWIGEKGNKPILDTLLLAYLDNENRHKKGITKPYALETLALEYLGFRWYAETGIKTRRDRLAEEPLDKVNRYVGFDAAVTSRLFNQIVDWMIEEDSDVDLLRVASKLYGPATLYTSNMTRVGQKIDIDLLRMLRAPDSAIVHRVTEVREAFAKSPLVAKALKKLKAKSNHGSHGIKPMFSINSSSSEQFNINSPDHLKILFWEVMKLKGADKSVDKDWQNRHKDKHPLVSMFQEYQQLSKLDNAYLAPIAEYVQQSADGRVRPSFNLANTVSGRLSAEHPNCYDGETDIMTRRGWVPFPELQDSDEVAQWWSDSDYVDFVVPHEVVRQPYSGGMVSLQNQHIDLVLTPNHRCPLINRKTGKLLVTRADSYKEDYKQIHASQWRGGSVSLTEAEVAIICAAQADGHWRSDVSRGAMEWIFTKQRKIERLRWALGQTKGVFTDSPKTVGDVEGRRLYLSRSLALEVIDVAISKDKIFSADWVLSLDRVTLDLFVAEVNNWDGCSTWNNQYASLIKGNVDAVQIAMTLSGISATVNPHPNKGWVIYQTSRNYSITTNIERNELVCDDMVYCVAVPSSFVVVRRNGKPCISGNTQNVPRSDSRAKKQIKSLFTVPEGKVMVQLDFSQAEVRWLGILSGDENLAEKYAMAARLAEQLLREPSNKDVQRALLLEGDLHMSTAIGMYKLADEDCLDDSGDRTKFAKDKRQAAKSVCFGLIYGKHYKSLARDLGIPEDEALEAVDKWMGQFPQAAEWLNNVDNTIADTCVSRSPFGRWRRLAEAAASDTSVANRAKRQARNTPIQSAASDFCIYAACKLRTTLRNHPNPRLREETLLINTVHDSVVTEVPADPDVVREYCAISKEIFIDPKLIEEDFGIEATVPLAVDFEVGLNWGNMHDYNLTEESLKEALFDAEVLRGSPTGTIFSDLKGKGVLYAEVHA